MSTEPVASTITYNEAVALEVLERGGVLTRGAFELAWFERCSGTQYAARRTLVGLRKRGFANYMGSVRGWALTDAGRGLLAEVERRREETRQRLKAQRVASARETLERLTPEWCALIVAKSGFEGERREALERALEAQRAEAAAITREESA